MIEFKNSEYVPCQYKLTLQNRGQEETHFTNDKEYWQDMVAKHEHLTDLNFKEVVFTSEQDTRLQEIADDNIPKGFQAEVRNYIETGEFPEGYNHPLSDLKQKKEKEKYDNDLDDAYQMILESEGLI